MAGNIREIGSGQYEKEVLQGGNVVIDFYSTECPPCEALAPKYESLSELYGEDIKFLKIFRQENRELAESMDIRSSPTVLFYKDGQRTGDTLSGGIKRSDLIKNLDAMIPVERSAEIKSGIKKVDTECDILVVGGGPAGLTAGIYASQAKMKTIVADIALPGGQVTTTHLVSNFPGFEKPIEGFMLMHFMTEQAKNAGVIFRSAVEISDVDLDKKKILVDGFETITAKKIIIATGSSYRSLGVSGEAEYKGKGISYCATCDAKYYENKHVVVIGGGNSAIEESLFITKFAEKVTIVHQFDKLQANKAAQERAFANEKISFTFEHEPREFKKLDDGTMEIQVENMKTGEYHTLACDGVFIFAGMKPNLELFGDSLATDEWGYLDTDDFMRTSISDIFAAGDVKTKAYRQITTSVADGTIAAITAAKEIEEAEG
jgi:thioredoxin reductase (NADPH)